MYSRILKDAILKHLFKGKVIILTGARQVGKTTLTLNIVEHLKTSVQSNVLTLNCDNPTDREVLNNKNLDFLIKVVGSATLILIDEGQKVETIGQTLKLLVDHYKDMKQFIVTGSSSFNLLTNTQEPLTGRKYEYTLFPLSVEEIHPTKSPLLFAKELESWLIFGSYPEIITDASFGGKRERLKQLTLSYLYKDILEFQDVRNPAILTDLLKALALQIGSEVSYTELSSLLGISRITVERYIDLLEKNFIIFRLHPFSREKRRVISKMKKIYFYDLGIRNAIIDNFNFLDRRDDVGALWENFAIVERMKHQSYRLISSGNYFWRTYNGSEVDFIEERDGQLFGYEFKWNPKKKVRIPTAWLEYPHTSHQTITPDNALEFIA